MSRADKIRQVAQQAHDNGDCDCNIDVQPHDRSIDVQPHDSHISITLSRESAEALHRYYPAEDRPHEIELDAALRAALEAEQ